PLAGTLWTRLGNRRIGTAVDLSALPLRGIKKTAAGFTIGAMTTLRDVELDEELNDAFDGVFRETVKDIVGVQLRHAATMGGSVWGRFGFSDVITLLLALNADIHLYDNGWLDLKDFIGLSRKTRDLLTEIKVPWQKTAVYRGFRLTATDLPLLNCAIAKTNSGNLRVVLGARPAIAELVIKEDPLAQDMAVGPLDLTDKDSAERQTIQAYAKELAAEFTYGTNLRASGSYRRHIAAVVLDQCLIQLYESLQRDPVKFADQAVAGQNEEGAL
ncbi:MAG TPA: hypothetical protein GX717_05420, partial [Clostridiaceae bacterium]|nr:hypothetical protein [Clostridiaceae bacterium]